MVLIKLSIFLSMLGEPIISRFRSSPVLLIFQNNFNISAQLRIPKFVLRHHYELTFPKLFGRFLSTPVLTSDVRFLFCLIELSVFSVF